MWQVFIKLMPWHRIRARQEDELNCVSLYIVSLYVIAPGRLNPGRNGVCRQVGPCVLTRLSSFVLQATEGDPQQEHKKFILF